MKQREFQEGRLREEKLIAEREREAGQAKLMEAQLYAQPGQGNPKIRAKEEKFAVEKEKWRSCRPNYRHWNKKRPC